MPDINTQLDTLASNMQQVQNSRSVLGVDRKGGLIRLNFKAKVAQALVRWGVASEGKLGGRIAVALAGKENFALLCQPSMERLKNSVRNIVMLLKQLETQGLDNEIDSIVREKIDKMIPRHRVSVTKSDLANLHELIHKEIIPQRLNYRSGLMETLEQGKATPAIQGATYRGVAVAAAALERNMEERMTLSTPADRGSRIHKSAGDGSDVRIAGSIQGYSGPVGEEFVKEVCGRKQNSDLRKRDVWDANRILGELRSAELAVRDGEHSVLEELVDQQNELQTKIANEGSNMPPEQTAEWELQLHTLESKIKNKRATMDADIKDKVATLKNNLLVTLEKNFGEKEAQAKLTESVTKVNIPPKSPSDDNSLSPSKPLLKKASQSSTESGSEVTAKPKSKKSIRFGGVQVQEIGKSYTDSGYKVNDENRSEWVQTIRTALDESEDAQVPFEIAKALHRGGDDDPKTVREINLLRMHPLFLKPENFKALYINLKAAILEDRKFPEKFPDEVKQNYRQHADVIKELAQQKIDEAKKLSTQLKDYEQALEQLPEDPQKREAQMKEIKEKFEYKDFEAYKETFDTAEFKVTRDIGGSVVTAAREMRDMIQSMQGQAQSVITMLETNRLFTGR